MYLHYVKQFLFGIATLVLLGYFVVIVVTSCSGIEPWWLRYSITPLAVILGLFGAFKTIREYVGKIKIGIVADYVAWLDRFSIIRRNELEDETLSEQSINSILQKVHIFCQSSNDALLLNADFKLSSRELHVENWKRFGTSDPVEVHMDPTVLVTECLEDHQRCILVTGQAGAGKSHLLKTISSNLVTAYEPGGLIPVYIPAATYQGESSIEEWITNTVKSLFGIVEVTMKRLLKRHNVVLIVDGLDEVDVEYRTSLMLTLHREYQNCYLLFSCRSWEYLSFSKEEQQVHDVSINLERLTEEFVKELLLPVVPTENHFHLDSLNLSIIDTPLLASLMGVVINEQPELFVDYLDGSVNEDNLLNRLWGVFIERSQKRKEIESEESEWGKKRGDKIFSVEQIYKYGNAIATTFADRTFKVSQLQPDTISNEGNLAAYLIFSRLFIGALVGFGTGFLFVGGYDFAIPGALCGVFLGCMKFLNYRANEQVKAGGYLQVERIPTKLAVKAAALSVQIPKAKSGLSKTFLSYKSVYLGIACFITITVLAFYFGFTGMRQKMVWNDSFALADMALVILLGFLFVILVVKDDVKYSIDRDIHFFEETHFRQNILKSVKGSLISSVVFTGLVVLFAKLFIEFPEHALTSYVFGLVDYMEFPFAVTISVIVFPIAFFFLLFIGATDPDDRNISEKQLLTRRRISFFTRSTLKNSILIGLVGSIGFGALWFFIGAYFSPYLYDSIVRACYGSIAVFVLLWLYSGGIELIKLLVLRVIETSTGGLPFAMDRCLRNLEYVGVLRRQGAFFSFRHATLAKCLAESPVQKNTRSSAFVLFPVLLCVLVVALITFFDVANRSDVFWASPGKGLIVSPNSSFEQIDSTNTFIVKESGRYQLRAEGKVRYGRAAGYHTARGTEMGFFNLWIGDEFDRFKDERHGALLMRRQGSNKYEDPFGEVNFDLINTYFSGRCLSDTLEFQRGDSLFFTLNDIEYENNSDEIVLFIDPLP